MNKPDSPSIRDVAFLRKKCLTQSRQDAKKTGRRCKVMPDFQERKAWLQDNGAGMDLQT
jgi:hypothetical protein